MNAETFHAGERALQDAIGVGERMAELGPRVIRPAMPEQHREFMRLLPYLVVGSIDGDARPSASILAGAPGFVHAEGSLHLRVDALPAVGDPLQNALRPGAAIGVLGIELQTRRRNRVNGIVRAVDDRGFLIEVQQSFGNCNKYIQARSPTTVGADEPAAAATRAARLDGRIRGLIAGADTFFIATAYPDADGSGAHGVDVSHRGGGAGFVQVDGDVLTVPDYSGNRFFNTLGNLMLNPRAGLLLVDFDRGDLVHLDARAEVLLGRPDPVTFPGAERLLRLSVDGVTLRPGALPLRWSAAQRSAHLPMA